MNCKQCMNYIWIIILHETQTGPLKTALELFFPQITNGAKADDVVSKRPYNSEHVPILRTMDKPGKSTALYQPQKSPR